MLQVSRQKLLMNVKNFIKLIYWLYSNTFYIHLNNSFIAKLLPADDPARACVFEANLLEKEIELYFELLPSLKQFIRLTEMKGRQQVDKQKSPGERKVSWYVTAVLYITSDNKI